MINHHQNSNTNNDGSSPLLQARKMFKPVTTLQEQEHDHSSTTVINSSHFLCSSTSSSDDDDIGGASVITTPNSADSSTSLSSSRKSWDQSGVAEAWKMAHDLPFLKFARAAQNEAIFDCLSTSGKNREKIIDEASNVENVVFVDVGCGSGHTLSSIAKAFPSLCLSGIDISQEAIDMCRIALNDEEVQNNNTPASSSFRNTSDHGDKSDRESSSPSSFTSATPVKKTKKSYDGGAVLICGNAMKLRQEVSDEMQKIRLATAKKNQTQNDLRFLELVSSHHHQNRKSGTSSSSSLILGSLSNTIGILPEVVRIGALKEMMLMINPKIKNNNSSSSSNTTIINDTIIIQGFHAEQLPRFAKEFYAEVPFLIGKIDPSLKEFDFEKGSLYVPESEYSSQWWTENSFRALAQEALLEARKEESGLEIDVEIKIPEDRATIFMLIRRLA